MTAIAAAQNLSFANFGAGAVAADGVMLAQTEVGGFSRFLSSLGDKAADFIKDVGRNLGKSVVSTLIAGAVVGGLMVAMPALPAAGALMAGGVAGKLTQSVIEAVVSTVIDNSIEAAEHKNQPGAQASKPAQPRMTRPF